MGCWIVIARIWAVERVYFFVRLSPSVFSLAGIALGSHSTGGLRGDLWGGGGDADDSNGDGDGTRAIFTIVVE